MYSKSQISYFMSKFSEALSDNFEDIIVFAHDSTGTIATICWPGVRNNIQYKTAAKHLILDLLMHLTTTPLLPQQIKRPLRFTLNVTPDEETPNKYNWIMSALFTHDYDRDRDFLPVGGTSTLVPNEEE